MCDQPTDITRYMIETEMERASAGFAFKCSSAVSSANSTYKSDHASSNFTSDDASSEYVSESALDVDAEQELSGRLGVQQLPTVMGFSGGTVPKDGQGNPLVLVGAVPQPQVAQFISLLASLAP